MGNKEFRVSISLDNPADFDKIASNAFEASNSSRSWLTSIEKATNLTRGSARRSLFAASIPFRCGMPMSRRTRSQLPSMAFLTASKPFSASPQTLKRFVASTNFRMAPRTAALSSAMRIHGLRPTHMLRRIAAIQLVCPCS